LMQKILFYIRFINAVSCFERMCLSSGGQNFITQPLVSSHQYVAVSCNVQRGLSVINQIDAENFVLH